MLTHLSLFSGIGGLDIAAEWAGFMTVGQCEWANFPTKILEKHWPDVPRWRDIRTLTGDNFYEKTGLRTADILSGGFPCQPFSCAGKRRNKDDDRYLWPEMLRVIDQIRPAWVVGENVAGIINLALDDVLADLEAKGYEAGAVVLPACGVGAPHRRYRVAIVAHHHGVAGDPRRAEPTGQQRQAGLADGGDDMGHAHRDGSSAAQIAGGAAAAGRHHAEGTLPPGEPTGAGGCHQHDGVAHAHRARRCRQDPDQPDLHPNRNSPAYEQAGWAEPGLAFGGGEAVAHAAGRGLSQPEHESGRAGYIGAASAERAFPADTDRWPTQPGLGQPSDGLPGWVARYLALHHASAEAVRTEDLPAETHQPFGNGWWGGPIDAWDSDWDNIPRVVEKNTVINRVDKLKALGNAVVPQQFYPVFLYIHQIMRPHGGIPCPTER